MNLFRKLASFILGQPVAPSSSSSSPSAKYLDSWGEKLKPGDVVTLQRRTGTYQGKWIVYKVLAVDQYPNVSSTIHCLTYKPQESKPTVELLSGLSVLIYHSPISANGFDETSEVLCQNEVTDDDLKGFIEYLRRTDLNRYCQLTGQDLKHLLTQAMEYYNTANELCEQGQREAGIKEYQKAIDLNPMYFEAIDNLAFTHMELGDYQSALERFKESLSVNPNGPAAYFSLGECLLRLGEVEDAIAILKQSSVRFPSTKSMCDKLLGIVESVRRGDA